MNGIKLNDIIKLVEKAYRFTDGNKLICSNCGRAFYKINFVEKDQSDIILIEDNVKVICDDHLIWDLLIDPEVFEQIYICKRISITQIEVRKKDAKLFLPNRIN